MEPIFIEIMVIFLLILANGFFAGSELAIISARKSTVSGLVAEGDARAKVVEQLQSDPHRFLATVQIGVTVVGSLASAVGGATAVEYLKPVLMSSSVEFVRQAAEPLSIGLVVIAVSYFSLILGELAPKTIGLQYADRMSLIVAKPIQSLSVFAGIAVSFLTLSNRAVLALLGVKTSAGQAFITREEVLHTVSEGGDTGALSELERKVIENMLDFSQNIVREIMVPRTRMVAVDLSLPMDEVMRVVRENMYTRYPVYDGKVDEIAGFVHGKDLLMGRMDAEPEFSLSSVMRPAFFVPETKKAGDLLREMQRTRTHMAIVLDEYGGVSGLVTTEDLLEELVGEIEDEHDTGETRHAVRHPDGSFLVDGFISMNDLEEVLQVKFEEHLPYDTLAGLILDELRRFPEKGERLRWREYTLVCEDVTKTAIVKVRIRKSAAPGQ
ncbi:MAG: HlyC/CorC family transporter [Nitrospirae bacterium]|nr:HlyC/CorC family transporter [Nitrospirota bacterium]